MSIEKDLQTIAEQTVSIYNRGLLDGAANAVFEDNMISQEYIGDSSTDDAKKPISSNATAGARNIETNSEIFNDYNSNQIDEGIQYATVQGQGNIANANHQTVIGKYNETNENALFIIGNGSEENRSNAFMVLNNGVIIAGDGEDENSLTTKKYVDSELVNTKGLLEQEIARVENLATAERANYVFDTEQDLKNAIDNGSILPNIGDKFYIIDSTSNDYWWDGLALQPMKGDKLELVADQIAYDTEKSVYDQFLAIENDIKTKPGLNQKNNNEIFNDLNNNQVGSKAFVIQEIYSEQKVIVLDSVEGLNIDDIYSLVAPGNYENIGKITNIYNEGLLNQLGYPEISVDYLQPSLISGNVQGKNYYFRIIAKPEVGTTTIGSYAHAEGFNTKALMACAHAEGQNTIAAGKNAHTEGVGTMAGWAGHAEGNESEAMGHAAHAEGHQTKAYSKLGDSAEGMHAEGYGAEATYRAAHAEGYYTKATETAAHAEGWRTEANHIGAHTGGYQTFSSRDYQTTIGEWNIENANALFVVGCGSETEKANAFEVLKDGSAIIKTVGSSLNSIVNKDYINNKVIAKIPTNIKNMGNGGLAMGNSSVTGIFSLATGYSSTASGKNSVATNASLASGDSSFAANSGQATGARSFATGEETEAIYADSAVFGAFTKTSSAWQMVVGKGNEDDPNALFIVGKGWKGSPSNAFKVLNNGNVWVSGEITANNIALTEKIAELEARLAALEGGTN